MALVEGTYTSKSQTCDEKMTDLSDKEEDDVEDVESDDEVFVPCDF